MKPLKGRLEALNPFTKAHGLFMGGAAISQMIPLMSAPIISRLYTQTDFGEYAIFYGVVAIITSVIHLSLQNGILLEETDEGAACLALLSLSVCFVIAGSMAIAYLITPIEIFEHLFGIGFVGLLPFLPITLALTGAYTCLYTWWVRRNLFSELGFNQLVLAFSTAVVQVAIGLVGLDVIGFVYANIIGNILALMLLVRVFLRDMQSLDHNFGRVRALGAFQKHRNLVVFTTPSGLLNSGASYLPDFLLNALFGAALLGQYSLANRVVNMPLAFFSSAVQDIFRQQAAREYNLTGVCKETFNKFLIVMTMAALLILVPVVLALPLVFPVIFGEQWVEAGKLMQPLVVLIGLRFISSPLSYVWIIKGR